MRSGEWTMGDSWMAFRAALRASSSSLLTVSVPLPLSVESGREESKLEAGKTRLGLLGSRPRRRGFLG